MPASVSICCIISPIRVLAKFASVSVAGVPDVS